MSAKRCVLCHDSDHSDGLCRFCAEDLSDLYTDSGNSCPRCAGHSTGGAVCGQCQNRPPPFERLWASVYYEPPLSNMIQAFKHKADLSMLPPLAALMKSHPPDWLSDGLIDCILAMPLSKERRLFRGFNQCDELARLLGRHYRLPVLPHNTVTRLHRPPQSTLKSSERQRNIVKAFQVANKVVERRKILLIDDVVTTGATLTELAQTLKKSGAEQIFCWTLARPQWKK
ncbi:putative GntX-like protein [Neisseria weaveri]|uniref:Putative GntX-like protein n=1 Tax=Neisseria weaveri TaxID=28091 RepID=A0A448VN35_9NEIS|nr:putative GntX-like protein [Neisseria weaveri]